MIATLSSKGQITIPVSIREFLGIKTGDSIDFVFTKNETIEMIPARTPVQVLRGLLRLIPEMPYGRRYGRLNVARPTFQIILLLISITNGVSLLH